MHLATLWGLCSWRVGKSKTSTLKLGKAPILPGDRHRIQLVTCCTASGISSQLPAIGLKGPMAASPAAGKILKWTGETSFRSLHQFIQC